MIGDGLFMSPGEVSRCLYGRERRGEGGDMVTLCSCGCGSYGSLMVWLCGGVLDY